MASATNRTSRASVATTLLLGASLLAACQVTPDTPLAAAAASGKAADVRSLLAAGARIGDRDSHGLDALIWAVRRGQSDALDALIAAGADLNRVDTRNGWTPLMHAIHTNQPAAVHRLLEAGANPNNRTHDPGALLMASGYGYTSMVEDLLAYGADPYVTGADGLNALSAAVGGVPDIDRFTVGSCQTATVKALLARAPDLRVDTSRFIGRWSMRFASLGGCKDVLDLVATRTR